VTGENVRERLAGRATQTYGSYGGVSPEGQAFGYRYPQAANQRGRGPRGYQRSDERIYEQICERLTDDDRVDASEIEIRVTNGEVTLTGRVRGRNAKRRAADLAEGVAGVKDVHNAIRVSDEQTWPPGAESARR
jgi:osmotically-inducible protein OsmY